MSSSAQAFIVQVASLANCAASLGENNIALDRAGTTRQYLLSHSLLNSADRAIIGKLVRISEG